MACQYSIFTPQQPEASDKTQKQSVLVEHHPHPFPDRDARSALAWQYADQMLHTGTARPLLHRLSTYQQATSQTALQVTVFVPTLSTSINELNELSANHTMLCMRNHPGSQYNHIHFSQYSSQTIWHNYGRFRGMERGNKGKFARGLHFAHYLHLLVFITKKQNNRSTIVR